MNLVNFLQDNQERLSDLAYIGPRTPGVPNWDSRTDRVLTHFCWQGLPRDSLLERQVLRALPRLRWEWTWNYHNLYTVPLPVLVDFCIVLSSTSSISL